MFDWNDNDLVVIYRKEYTITYRRDRILEDGTVAAVIDYKDGRKKYVILDTTKGNNYVVSN